jgi:toxic protein SymE
MANANLKPRRARGEHSTRISVVLEHASEPHGPQEQQRRVAFPWMQVADALLEHAGFRPGQPVLFSVDYRFGQIMIGADKDYTIAGRQMTQSEIRRRGGLKAD